MPKMNASRIMGTSALAVAGSAIVIAGTLAVFDSATPSPAAGNRAVVTPSSIVLRTQSAPAVGEPDKPVTPDAHTRAPETRSSVPPFAPEVSLAAPQGDSETAAPPPLEPELPPRVVPHVIRIEWHPDYAAMRPGTHCMLYAGEDAVSYVQGGITRPIYAPFPCHECCCARAPWVCDGSRWIVVEYRDGTTESIPDLWPAWPERR